MVRVQIQRATTEDIDVLSVLIGEIEEYYGGENAPGDVELIRRNLFGSHPVAHVLLAREGNDVLGMASYSFLWPAAGAEASLYLKELFVRESGRRRGVATALMAELEQTAAEAACSRVEWTADRDNPAALAFYEALGAKHHEGKVFYRVAVA